MTRMETLTGLPKTVLLVEDDPAHAELIILAFEEQQVSTTVYHVTDGEAALDYLYRRGAHADPETSPRPHMILLDLRLPKTDGLDVLKTIRAADNGRLTIPVVVLTTSGDARDVNRAYELCANSYLIKPVGPDDFSQLLENIGSYWLSCNRYIVA